jgi:hypothetical protein
MAEKSKSELRTEREERLAKALRDNLAKRKAQTRARSETDTSSGSDKKSTS